MRWEMCLWSRLLKSVELETIIITKMRLFHFGPLIATVVTAETTSWLNSNQIVKEGKNEIRQEEVAGIFDEMTINELLDLNLYEGDIILDQGQDQVQGQNIQRDLTYRWPNGKIQSLSLGTGCDRMATIMHEFTHALGLKHTQARPDRDEAVTIMYENIKEGKEHNFDKADDFSYMTMGSG